MINIEGLTRWQRKENIKGTVSFQKMKMFQNWIKVIECIILNVIHLFILNSYFYRHTSFHYTFLSCASKILFFTTEGLWQPCIKQVYSNHFSQQHLLTSCLCVTFCQFCQYFKPSTSKITTTPPQTKNYSSLKALMMVSIFFFFYQ